MAEHVHFNYMTMSMSAYDAVRLVNDPTDAREFQLARAADSDPHHEIEFRLEVDPDTHVPGDPISPAIASAELSPSNFYVDFRFEGTPVYMTIAATSTVTLGWLRESFTMPSPIVIEPGTPAYTRLAAAIAIGHKVSIEDRGVGRVAIKASEFMWSPALVATKPGRTWGPGFEPPANS